ncbi:alpha-L-fucosidase [Persicitalea jodogahamensis]|uniref:alpha-L-fucosidase n=1 Tax=Persicitalea jodogahamensis TaxID=402147 RepID=UPI0035B5965A
MLFFVVSGRTIEAQSVPRYEPDWNSIRAQYQKPKWFRDAQFGIFLHLGPYSILAYSRVEF